MALINPVHGLVAPFLCFFTIPLAIFAGITTTLAFTVLMFHVATVYLDVALGLIPYYFTQSRSRILPKITGNYQQRASREALKTPISPPGSAGSGSGYSTPAGPSPFPSAGNYTTYISSGYRSPSLRRQRSVHGFGTALRRSRRSSQVSLASLGTITPIHEGEVEPSAVMESGMTPSVGLNRDFEGVGGWRLLDQEDDGNWANINSRLELPLERAAPRHRQRSQSLGPASPGEIARLTPKHTNVQPDHPPDGKGWERTGSVAGAKSSGNLFGLSGSSRKLNQQLQLPSALTVLDQGNGYFPEIVSSGNWKKPTP